jgi:hypothetical protein
MAYYPGWIAFSDPAKVMPVNDFRRQVEYTPAAIRRVED